jgi:hypothetical protein
MAGSADVAASASTLPTMRASRPENRGELNAAINTIAASTKLSQAKMRDASLRWHDG